MKVLITGATGYVGRNLINVIDRNVYKLYAVVRDKQKDFPEGIEQIVTDELFESRIKNINPNVVVHLASHLTSRSEKEDINKLIEANITFGSHLLNALKKTNLRYFINTGSFAEYHYNDGQLIPTYYYAATKTAFRSILKYFSEVNDFKVFHIVPFSIYGGNDRQKKIIDILFDSLVADSPLKLSEGNQSLDFIHLNDVLEFFILVLNNLEKINHEETFFLGTGKTHTIRELAELIASVTNYPVNISWGALPARERDTLYAAAPISKIKKVFNWQPSISLEEGIKLKCREFFNP